MNYIFDASKLQEVDSVLRLAPRDIRFKEEAFIVIKLFLTRRELLSSMYVEITEKEQRKEGENYIQLVAPHTHSKNKWINKIF